MLRLCAIVAGAILVVATVASAQTPRLVGNAIGGAFHWHSDAGTTTDTRTLRFDDAQGRQAFTVEFQVVYPGQRAAAAPAVVDMIVTQHPADEAQPQVTLNVNGEALAVVTRPRTERSVVVSMPFDEFTRLANAETIVQRVFDTDLEFGAGQLRMLRTTAVRWAGR